MIRRQEKLVTTRRKSRQASTSLGWQERSTIPIGGYSVGEEDGVPVGTIRADTSGGVWELSWTVAANARGQGLAKQMVALLAHQIPEPIRAEVKVGNIASARIAEQAGMEFDREEDGVLHYRRAALI